MKTGLIAAALVCAVSSCTMQRSADKPKPSTTISLPCGGGAASTAELGSPIRGGSKYALFTTVGGEVHVTARHFEHGGYFDPARGSTLISVGPPETPPVLNEHTGQVEHATAEVSVKERAYGTLTLSPGRYWLVSSTGGDVLVTSCQASAFSDVQRV